MADEFAAPGSGLDISVRDYLDFAHRRRAIIIQAVIAGGFALTLTQKPSYRPSTRIMLEDKRFPIGQCDPNNLVSGLFMQDNGHDFSAQIEVIQGEQVLVTPLLMSASFSRRRVLMAARTATGCGDDGSMTSYGLAYKHER